MFGETKKTLVLDDFFSRILDKKMMISCVNKDVGLVGIAADAKYGFQIVSKWKCQVKSAFRDAKGYCVRNTKG